jgi:hypothetical protein
VSLGREVPEAVLTLFRNWGHDHLVRAALREEQQRRIDLAKAPTQQRPPLPGSDDLGREERKAEAARIYPTPDQAYTREVTDFIRLLLEAAPEKELQAAADKIQASASAREDINRHTVELATAYRLYGEPNNQHGIDRSTAWETGR